MNPATPTWHETAAKSSTVPCFFPLATSVRLPLMQSRVAVVAHLVQAGDETSMKMISIGGEGALLYRLR